MNKVLKFSAAFVALLILLVAAGVQLTSAQTLDATVDADFISNDNDADNTVVIIITDANRNDNNAGVDLIPGSEITILNVQSGESITTTASEVAASGTSTPANDTGIFRATFNVISASSTDTAIQASDGQQIRVSYTTLSGSSFSARTPSALPFVNEIEVDGEGPVIENTSPVNALQSNASTQTFIADISDARSGIGTTDAAVRPRLTFTVQEEGLPVTLAAIDADSTQWRAQVQNTFLQPGTKKWQITAVDALGNTTISDSDADTEENEVFTVVIDLIDPRLSGATGVVGGTQATTGDIANASGTRMVLDTDADDRTSVRVGFNENLDGTSVASDGSDFLVLIGETQLGITGADWHSDLADSVFLSLDADLAADELPTVRVISEIRDVAGNTRSSDEVAALDGLGPALTVTITGTGASRPVTNDELVVRVTADEDSTNPGAATGVTVLQDVGANGALDGAAETATFEIVTDGRTWEWTYTFDGNGADDGLYNIFVDIRDEAGNVAIDGLGGTIAGPGGAGIEVDLESDDILLFEVDTDVGDIDVLYSDDDPNTFISLSFVLEGDEQPGDTHDTIVTLTATVDGDSVAVNTIDDITFTIAAPSGGWLLGDHAVVVNATDETGNTEESSGDTTLVTIVERAALIVPLRPGLNLISLPGAPASSDINDLIPLDHPVNQVLTYNPAVVGGWLVAERDTDGLFAGTLTNISAELAYFVRTTTFAPLEVLIPRLSAGQQVLPPSVPMVQGWNLMPVLDVSGDLDAGELIEANAYVSGIGAVRVFQLDIFGRLDPVDISANGDDHVAVGQGYWVFAADDTVLVP